LLRHTKYLWLKVHVKVYVYDLHFDQSLNIEHIKTLANMKNLIFFISALGYQVLFIELLYSLLI